mmetsp:Transcript_49365/g.107763  ORF Transcript_49365/g.107763 Transcript_49365/m.107763 type:complete len:266 (-) Transcript_49365:1724-2521(-)
MAKLLPPRLLPLQRGFEQWHRANAPQSLYAFRLVPDLRIGDDVHHLMLGSSNNHTVRHARAVVVAKVQEHLVLAPELQLGALVVHTYCATGISEHVPHDALIAMGDVRLFGVVRGVAIHLLDKRGHACVGRINAKPAVAPHAVNVSLPHAQLGEKISPGELAKIFTVVDVIVGVFELGVRLLDTLDHDALPLSHGNGLPVRSDLLRHVGMWPVRVLPLVVEPIEICITQFSGVNWNVLHSVPSHQLLHPSVPRAKIPGVAKLLKL